jgi:transposase
LKTGRNEVDSMANATTYTDEYRLECADYVISSGRPATEVARELGIHDKTLQRWVRARRDQLDGKASPRPESAEVRELRKRIRELEQENEFLKKASAFFAANQAR